MNLCRDVSKEGGGKGILMRIDVKSASFKWLELETREVEFRPWGEIFAELPWAQKCLIIRAY